MLSKVKIRKNFSRSAAGYDNFALFQQKCGERMLKEIDVSLKKTPRVILDIGCGTGRFTRQLAAIYPESAILGLDLAEGMVAYAKNERGKENFTSLLFCQAEAEHLPLPEGTFDLVVSNLTYQWVENLPLAFREVSRVLNKDGCFYFTTLGKGSLTELHASFTKAHRQLKVPFYPHGQDFIDQQKLKEITREAGFSTIEIGNSPEINYYPDVGTFLKLLKQVGANNASGKLSSRRINRKIIPEMVKIYDKNYRRNGNIPVSYEVIMGHGKKNKQSLVDS